MELRNERKKAMIAYALYLTPHAAKEWRTICEQLEIQVLSDELIGEQRYSIIVMDYQRMITAAQLLLKERLLAIDKDNQRQKLLAP